MTPKLTMRLRQVINNLRSRHGKRIGLLFSIASLLWGVISGLSLKRDFAHSRQLVAYLGLLVVASATLRIWLAYSRRLAERQAPVRGVRHYLLKRPTVVVAVAHFGTQCAAQYIAMFLMPMMVLAGAWTTLLLAVALAAVTLIDPVWMKLAQEPWCMALIRSFSAVTATAFAFPVFFPAALTYFYPTLAGIAIAAALPWDLLIHRRASTLNLYRFIPALGVIGIVGLEAMMHTSLRAPLLSLWLKNPAMGVGIDETNHRIEQTWNDEESPQSLAVALSSDRAICCLSPIVAPSGITATVTHEWLVNGKVVDRISLAPISSDDSTSANVHTGALDGNDHGFRTYSCKHHLPDPESVHTLTCRVYLGEDLYLGKTTVSFH